MLTPDFQKMILLVQQFHAHQTRSNPKVPYWHHCVSVTEILSDALEESGELADGALQHDLLNAALGHDLYEDTAVTREEIQRQFGTRTDELVWHLTNEKGDHDRSEYVAKISAAPEEAKLIKLADLVENTLSASYSVDDLGPEWVRTFFLPIIDEMAPAVTAEKFSRYPKTAALLNQLFAFARRRLVANAEKYESRPS